MTCYEQLYKHLNYLDDDKKDQIYRAYLFALNYHSEQKRHSGENYINHPIAVASILASMHFDYQSIIAAILHDVIEDTPVTKEEIINKFGQTIANLVDGVTKLNKIVSNDSNETQAQNFRKMVLAMSQDIRVILIKLADRLHNMRTLSSLIPFKQYRIAKETLDVYAPIANRLGMYQVSIELEDLAFLTMYPNRYKILEKSVKHVYGKNTEGINFIEQELLNIFSKSNIKNIKISSRMKHLYGIYRKMIRHKAHFASITDIYAFRIIVPNIDDCYRALGIVHNLYKPLPGKFKDYIAIPKFNGYQSLHTVLFGPYGAPVEVQIRTQLMDQMANDGIAAHWLYKNEENIPNTTYLHTQKWVNKLLELQQHSSNSSEFLENAKIDLFPDKVYVFTPKGKIMELPRGATTIDFAYAVHTDIGNTCVAARIDRKFFPLPTILNNGQTISIVTALSAEPNPNWLNFVVTNKARNSIRQYLKNKKQKELISLGKQLLNKAFLDLSFDFKKINSKIISTFLKNSGFKSLDLLYENIGLGNNIATLVAYQIISRNKKINTYTKPLIISGTEGVNITLSRCCCPIPGDKIIGYLNSNFGLDIHTIECLVLVNLKKQTQKCLPVNWSENIFGDFKVALDLEMINELGALAALAQVISKENANIEYISTGEQKGDHIIVSVHLLVKNLKHFEQIKCNINTIKSVISITRKNYL